MTGSASILEEVFQIDSYQGFLSFVALRCAARWPAAQGRVISMI